MTEYAPIWRRFLAAVLDFIVIFLTSSILAVLIGGTAGILEVGATTEDKMEMYINISTFILALLYLFLLPKLWSGLTVGKELMGIKVEKYNGDKVTYWSMTKRLFIAYFIFPVILSIFLSVYVYIILIISNLLLLLFRRDNRSYHDIIGGTHVIVYRKDGLKSSRVWMFMKDLLSGSQAVQEVKIAPIWRRLVANVIDGISIVIAVFLMSFLIIIATAGNMDNYDTTIDNILIFGGLLYPLVLPIIWTGLTIGKRMLGIKIVKASGEDVSALQIILRGFIIIFVYIASVGILFTLSIILMTSRKDKRSLHDIIAGTKVIKIEDDVKMINQEVSTSN
ncbi:RDD family protein [Lottiidibacillus patelloidae]|nr:RDD family protein [Lottiidibacillus patelloidae]